MKKRITMLVICLWILVSCSSCRVEKTDFSKIQDLEFSIVEESQVPEKLMELIEEKKENAFKISFDSEGFKYIAVGYGMQETGGYSISVEELYLSPNAIYIKTSLLGPSKGEVVAQVETYPYIIIKTEYLDKSIVFE